LPTRTPQLRRLGDCKLRFVAGAVSSKAHASSIHNTQSACGGSGRHPMHSEYNTRKTNVRSRARATHSVCHRRRRLRGGAEQAKTLVATAHKTAKCSPPPTASWLQTGEILLNESGSEFTHLCEMPSGLCGWRLPHVGHHTAPSKTSQRMLARAPLWGRSPTPRRGRHRSLGLSR